MEKVCKIYKKTFEDKSGLEMIAGDISIPGVLEVVSQIYDNSTLNTINKWMNKLKVCRTKYVMEAMGDKYPMKIAAASVAVDAIVNNYDDNLDEDLSPEEKVYGTFDSGRGFGFLIGDNDLNSEQRNIIRDYYMYTMPIIGGGEFASLDLIEKLEDENEILKIGKGYYDIRIKDMDVYPALALNELGYKSEAIMRAARNFRAVNLIKKDLDDVPKDMKNDNKTVLTIAHKKGFNLRELARKLAQPYLKDFKNFKAETPELETFKNNFHRMSEMELKSI